MQKSLLIKVLKTCLAHTLPIKKQVFFESFNGKQYSDNPRAVSEKLHEMGPDISLVWGINSDSINSIKKSIPEYVKIVEKGSLAYHIEFMKSFAFVTNENLNPNIVKRKNQFIVQTWHGDRVFKKILYEAWENGKRPTPVMDEFYTDLCVAGSIKGEQLFRDAFHYHGEILNIGCPRNDKLIDQDEDEAKKIKKRLGLEKGIKILLFAPTFRDNLQTAQKSPVELMRVIDLLEKKGDKWICLVRAHAHSVGVITRSSDKIQDVTAYPDMADLLLIADMLITDYSSCATDFVVTRKPIILAAFDRIEYMKSCRDFKYDINETGFVVADNQKQLEQYIDNLNDEDYALAADKVSLFYGINESGKSTEAVCKRIINNYKQK